MDVYLNVLPLAEYSPRRFLVKLWQSIVQAIVRIVERIFAEVVGGTKRLDLVFRLEGEGPRLRITKPFTLTLKLSFLMSFARLRLARG